MAKSSNVQGNNIHFWRADWFVGFLVVTAVLFLQGLTDFFGTLERHYYDHTSTQTPRRPWPRDVHAQLIDQLLAAKAKTNAQNGFLFEPQTDSGLDYILQVKKLTTAQIFTPWGAIPWPGSCTRLSTSPPQTSASFARSSPKNWRISRRYRSPSDQK